MTMLSWDFTQNNDTLTLNLKGALERDTLLPLWQQRLSFFTSALTEIHWNLTELEKVDSAGVATLAQLLHLSAQHYNKVQLISPPDQLLTLADLFGLTQYFTLFLAQD